MNSYEEPLVEGLIYGGFYLGWLIKKREICQTVIYFHYFLCYAAVSWYGKL